MTTVTEALDLLPADADEIATFFAARGIRARHAREGLLHTQSCPMAVFLQIETGFSGLSVGAALIGGAEAVRAILPSSARVFIVRYDNGLYPDLLP